MVPPALGCGCQWGRGKKAEGTQTGLVCWDFESTLTQPGAVSLHGGWLARLPPRHTPACVFPPPAAPIQLRTAGLQTAALV